MGPVQVGFDDHRLVGVMEGDQLVALVGERGARLLEVARHLVGAVEDVARADQLVARVVEGRERGVELVPVLGLHVLDNELLAPATKLRRKGHRLTHPASAVGG